MRKPNYTMERKDRERAKQAKAAAKVESRSAKRDESGPSDASTTDDHGHSGEVERPKSDD